MILWTSFNKKQYPDFLDAQIQLSDYRGYSIWLFCTNGGLLGGLIFEPTSDSAYYYDIEGFDIGDQELMPWYEDQELHLKACHEKIDSLIANPVNDFAEKVEIPATDPDVHSSIFGKQLSLFTTY